MTFRNRLRNYIRILAWILLIINVSPAKATLHETTSSDSTLMAYLNELGIETTKHNEVKILKSGHEKFIDLFEQIEKAKHHIHLEYFNFRNDSIANALFDILAKKVKEGVEVRAMYDALIAEGISADRLEKVAMGGTDPMFEKGYLNRVVILEVK